MPHSILDQLKASITPHLISEAANALGESPGAIKQAVDLALPALLSGLVAATRMPSGLSAVLRLVEDPVNDGTLLTQLTSLFKGTMTAAPIYRLGSQLLNAVFGSKLPLIAQGVGALSGIKAASANTLLHMLAPGVLGVLGNDHRAIADKSPEGFARFIDRQKAGLTASLAPTLAELVQAPMGAATTVGAGGLAATAAGMSASAGLGTGGGRVAPADQEAPRRIEAASHGAGVKPVVANPPMRAAVAAPVSKPADTKSGAARTAGGAAVRRSTDGEWEPGTKPLLVFLSLLGLGLLFLTFGLSREMAPDDKLAPKSAARAPVPAPALPVPQKAAEAKAVPAAAPPAPAAPAKAPVAPRTADAPKAKQPAPQAAVPPKPALPAGVTHYYGTTSKMAEAAAIPNPDYKPAPSEPKADAVDLPAPQGAAAPKPSEPSLGPPPGITTFFGQGTPSADLPAVPNPDYKPAVVFAPGPPFDVVDIGPGVPIPGVTSYYGMTAAIEDAPAVANPDYTPTPPGIAAEAGALAVAGDPGAPTVPGVTTYFGASAPRADASAVANTEYEPAAAATNAAAPVPAAHQSLSALIAGVTSFFGVSAPLPESPAKPDPGYTALAAAAAPDAVKTAAVAPASDKAQSGVTTYFGRPAEGPAAAKDAVKSEAACRQTIGDIVTSGVVLFRSGKADLTASSLPTLKRVVRIFKSCPGLRLRIEGHTDDTGGADMNLQLSKARARSVANFLVLRGIDPGRIVSSGFGMTQPQVPNTTPANKAQNRRIEFKVDKL